MSVPCARRIQDLADLVGADGNRRLRDKIGDADPDDGYYDAGDLKAHHVAREMLNDHPPGARVAKRALLFTNRDDPRRPGEDGRELVHQPRRELATSTASTCDASPSHHARGDDFPRRAVTTSPRGCWVCARWRATGRGGL